MVVVAGHGLTHELIDLVIRQLGLPHGLRHNTQDGVCVAILANQHRSGMPGTKARIADLANRAFSVSGFGVVNPSSSQALE